MTSEILLECLAAVTLSRDGQSMSLKPGARFKLDAGDDSIDDEQLRRALEAGKLRPVSGFAALSERLEQGGA